MNKLYKISENSPLKHLDIFLFDYLLLAVAYTFAYYVKFWDMGFITTDKWRAYFSIQCLVNFAVVVITGSYRGILQRTASEELIKTGQHAIYNFMITSIMFYVLKLGEAYSRTTSILLPVFFCSLSFIMRCLYKKAFRNDRKALFVEENSIFVIGKSKDIPKLIRSINSGFFKEYSIKGLCVVDAPLGEVFSSEIDVVKSSGKVEKERLEFKNEVAVEDVLRYVLKHKINEVFIGVEPSVLTSETYKAFVDNGKGIHLDIESMIGITSDSQLITTIGTNSTVSIGFHQFTGKQLIYLVIKRIIDVVSSLLVMILFVPVALVIKIAFMITGDFGSIFYAQNRIGMNGKPFRLFFRSVRWSATRLRCWKNSLKMRNTELSGKRIKSLKMIRGSLRSANSCVRLLLMRYRSSLTSLKGRCPLSDQDRLLKESLRAMEVSSCTISSDRELPAGGDATADPTQPMLSVLSLSTITSVIARCI